VALETAIGRRALTTRDRLQGDVQSAETQVRFVEGFMGCTVFANGRGIDHKDSGGLSPIFPDVCKTPTPGGPVPIPYPNVGQASQTSAGPTSVKVDGAMPMTKGAKYATTSGDEAGSLGGVVSGKVKGAAEYMLYSFDVKIEGKNACRLGDALFHNDKNGMG
jgi:hypothetical protein